jgi:hypothetical protein
VSSAATSSGFEPLQRLGDCAGFGEALIEVLELNGWTVHRRPAFGGGVLLLATHPDGWDVRAGGSMAGAAAELFQRAAAIIPPQDDALVLFA